MPSVGTSVHAFANCLQSFTLVLADIQGKYFDDYIGEHHILSLFNSGDKIEDLFQKYQDKIPSFDLMIIQIGSNNC